MKRSSISSMYCKPKLIVIFVHESVILAESVQKTENRSITNKPRPNKKKTLYTVSLPAKLIQVYVEDKVI